MAVGVLKHVKDYPTLLAAFAMLRQRVDARLLILGEGERRQALEEQANQLGIASELFMPGFVIDPAPYYEHADLHVVSSTGEGLSIVIIEALAAGTPVVSTDCPNGPREILDSGRYGRLVAVGDPAALAAAMFESLSAPPDRTMLRARAQDLSIARAVDKYETLLVPTGLGDNEGRRQAK